MTRTILRLPAVKATSGLSRSAIYALMAQGRFPRPLAIGIRAVGWLESEIDEWLSSRERAGCERTTKGRVVTTACSFSDSGIQRSGLTVAAHGLPTAGASVARKETR
jgi:prophage regulatory protein